MADSRIPRFKSIVLDVDSTLCGIEGVDWLAERRGESLARRVAHETELAMRGELTIDAVYAERLSLVAPTRKELKLLTDAYSASLAPGAAEAISRWLNSGIEVALVTGGFRQAIGPVAVELGIHPANIYAMDIFFDERGEYSGYDLKSPLSTAMGKREVVGALTMERPLLMVGDGMTDLSAKAVADAFVAFTGFATRPGVTSEADYVVATFDELDSILFGDD